MFVHFHVEDFLAAAIAYACRDRKDDVGREKGGDIGDMERDAKRTFFVGARLAVGALCYCLAYSARCPKVLGLAVLVDE